MFSKFFIHRPIFASSISIIIVIAGAIAYLTLPVAKYPEITPPSVRVSCFYPGASANVLAETVAAPIEQEVNGVEGMLYMSSTSAGDGTYTLDVTFELGTDTDIATVLVQNRVSKAEPRLPEEVRRQGVTTQKQTSTMVTLLSIFSPEGRYDDLFLSNYAMININDELKRIPGVGSTNVFPAKDYGMRLWLDPEKMKARELTANDVVAALREQNVQVAAGKIGAPPTPEGQAFQLTITTLGRLEDPEAFADVIVKVEDRRITRVKDVARVELGAKSYDMTSALNDRQACSIIVYQSPGSNAVQIAKDVRSTLERLKRGFPESLDYKVVYDVSLFVTESVKEVQKTLYEAVILVVLVLLVFLQSFRTTLIPLLTIPVSLVGTFVVLALLGYSVNMLTLFGLLLAIGTVVDDAIVVVENVERIMVEKHLAPKEATEVAMGEVFSAIIAISLVLMAVFVPSAMLPGITGELYRQFAVTIAVSTFFSAVNALTLSPALCGALLRPHDPNRRLNFFSRGFNSVFEAITEAYGRLVSLMTRGTAVLASLALFGGVLFLTYWGVKAVPTGFVPIEDQGLVLVDVRLPSSASAERTTAVLSKVTAAIRRVEGTEDVTTIGGFSMINAQGSNLGLVFATLKPWGDREKTGHSLEKILSGVQGELATIQEAQTLSFVLPTIDGVGVSAGFEMRLQDRTGLGPAALEEVGGALAMAGYEDPLVTDVYSTFVAFVPQLYAAVDREKVKKLGIRLQDVFDALQSYLGSAYVNDFNKFGRTFQVSVQAEGKFRARKDDISRIEVRSASGKMIPLGTLLRIDDTLGGEKVVRYNLFPCATVLGAPAPGASSGQALQSMEALAAEKLPPGMSYEWTAMAYQEKKTGSEAMMVYLLSLVLVYLILAAQYESWMIPFAVILSIPLAMLGAMLFLLWRGLDNNIFTSVGMVLLVGLAAKNAILIVEFARENRAKGRSIVESAILGAKTRFRPILMTSFTFILGCVPLMIGTGAGAASRQALGTAVVGGMIGGTVLGLIFTPALYVAIQWLSEAMGSGRPKVDAVAAETSAATATTNATATAATPGTTAPPHGKG